MFPNGVDKLTREYQAPKQPSRDWESILLMLVVGAFAMALGSTLSYWILRLTITHSLR